MIRHRSRVVGDGRQAGVGSGHARHRGRVARTGGRPGPAGHSAQSTIRHPPARDRRVGRRLGKAVEVGERLLTTLLAIDAAGLLAGNCASADRHAAVAATDWAARRTAPRRGPSGREHTGEEVVFAQVGVVSATVALGEHRLDEAMRLAHSAIDGGRGTGHAEIVVAALEVIGRVSRLRDIATARSVFVEQLAVAQEHGLTLWRLRALQQLGSLDVMTEARFERLRAARELAYEAGALATAATIDLQMASNLSSSFEVQESLALAEQCADVARRWKLGLLLPSALIVIARNHVIAGRSGDMVAALDEAERTGGGDRDVAVGVLGCRALRSLLEEDRPRALAALAEAMALVGGHPAATQRPFFGLYPLVATLERVRGDQARADTRTATAVGVACIEGLIEYADAIAVGRSGDADKAAAVFRAADAKFAPYQGRFAGWHQLGRRLVAEAALQDQWGDPVAWLTEAAQFFRRGRQDVVEQACRSLLRRQGIRVPRRTYGHSSVPERLAALGVTDREAEVGALVRAGSDQPRHRSAVVHLVTDRRQAHPAPDGQDRCGNALRTGPASRRLGTQLPGITYAVAADVSDPRVRRCSPHDLIARRSRHDRRPHPTRSSRADRPHR